MWCRHRPTRDGISIFADADGDVLFGSATCADQLTTPKKYSFVVPKDGGAGSKNREVFLLDMTLLEQTPLPLVIHDSVGIKQIEDESTIGLLEVYSRSEK